MACASVVLERSPELLIEAATEDKESNGLYDLDRLCCFGGGLVEVDDESCFSRVLSRGGGGGGRQFGSLSGLSGLFWCGRCELSSAESDSESVIAKSPGLLGLLGLFGSALEGTAVGSGGARG